MSLLNDLEGLFEGWRPSVTESGTGMRVTVPRMSEGAMRVMRSDIQARFPQVCHIDATPTPEGGYVFDLTVESQLPDNMSQLLLGVRSKGLSELETQIRQIEAMPADATRAPYMADLAVSLEERKEFDLARRGYLLALWLDPNLVKVRFNYGTLLLKTGEIAAAVKVYEEIVQLDPSFEPALHNLTAYHAQRGDRQLARDYLNRLVSSHPSSPTAHLLAGQIAQQEGQLPIALEHYVRATRFDPGSPEAYFRAAVVMRELEMEPEALEQWELYRARSGTIPDGRYLASRVLVHGNPEGADLLLDGVPMGRTPRALMDLPPGFRQLTVRALPAEITLSMTLEPARNYLVRYDLPAQKMTFETTVVDMKLKDESGQEILGAELGRRILERMDQVPKTAGLSAREVFACVLHECLKDRELSDSERDLIFAVKQLLKIPADVHQQVFREVEERLRHSGGGGSEAQPEEIYRLLAHRVLEDGRMLTKENVLLTQIGRLLAIPRPRRHELEQEVLASLQKNTVN